MASKRHQLLYDHYVSVLGYEPDFSLKLKKEVLPTDMKPIKTFVLKPTDELPFWKLCTIGASDYEMPEREIGWGQKGEPSQRVYDVYIPRRRYPQSFGRRDRSDGLAVFELTFMVNGGICVQRKR